MLRATTGHISKLLRVSIGRLNAVGSVRATHDEETEEELNRRYEDFFNRNDIDGWDIRQGMNDLAGMDFIPDPKIIVAALKACRRVNDIALAIRWMETCSEKCGDQRELIYPYLLKRITPCLTELGIPTPADLNYHKPELALPDIYDM